MRTLFLILIPISLLAVVVVLALGLRAMNKSGPEWRERSNKLMRLRIGLQMLALAIIAIAFWWSSSHPR